MGLKRREKLDSQPSMTCLLFFHIIRAQIQVSIVLNLPCVCDQKSKCLHPVVFEPARYNIMNCLNKKVYTVYCNNIFKYLDYIGYRYSK